MENHKETAIEKAIADANKCAKIGKISELHKLIGDQPDLLDVLEKRRFADTPLHAAAAVGQTSFAVEILNLAPSLGSKLNRDGLSPLHLAVIENQTDTAKALVRIDKQLVRVKGFGGFTPLHCAASLSGSIDKEMLAEFLFGCPEAINDLTNRFQTAVHLAVEENYCESVMLILSWVQKASRESVLGVKDVDGNTALHIAAKNNCAEGMETMLKKAKRNKMNNKDKTPLDIAKESLLESNDDTVRKLLEKYGALSGDKVVHKKSHANYLLDKTSWWETFVRLYYFLIKDLTLEMRNVVLVVAALITTATYAAVLQPPGGINQVSADPNTSVAEVIAPPPKPPGKMVMSGKQYENFMPANTAAFTMSVVIIIFMLHGRPYNIILHACLIFMSYSYLFALNVISNVDNTTDVIYILSWYSISGAFAVKMLYYFVKALYEDMWWLPGGAVGASNLFDRCTMFRKTVSALRAPRRQYKLLQNSDPKKQAAG